MIVLQKVGAEHLSAWFSVGLKRRKCKYCPGVVLGMH